MGDVSMVERLAVEDANTSTPQRTPEYSPVVIFA
jgi:hypothetical protein